MVRAVKDKEGITPLHAGYHGNILVGKKQERCRSLFLLNVAMVTCMQSCKGAIPCELKLGVIVRARETEVYFCLFHSHYDAMLYADMGLHLNSSLGCRPMWVQNAKQKKNS